MVKLVHSEDDSRPKGQKPSPAAEKAAARAARAPRGRWRRALKVSLLTIFVLVFFSSGWFTYKVAAATGKIFTSNTTGGSPILRGKKLKDDEQGRINILLLGIGGQGHDGPNLTDTIQVVSIDAKAKKAAMLSIPRDLYVTVPDADQKVKINEVHAIGEDNGSEGGGPALDKQLISSMLGIQVHYFVRVDFEGFRDVINDLGGVDINVTERLYDPYYPAGESTGYQVVDIKPGVQHLNGDIALQYARSRETTTDFDRSRRQQEVMVATRDKALQVQSLTNPAKISGLIDTLGDHVKTDLSIGEMERLASITKDIPAASVNSKVLDTGPEGLLYDSTGPGGAFILLPRSGNYDDIRAFAHQLFEGVDIGAEHAGVELLNASGRSGVAAQESTILAGYGYTITSTGNAETAATQTIIYDFTNGAKPHTISELQKRYQAQVIKQPASQPGVDVRVVIGSSYSSQEAAGSGGEL